MFVFSGERFDAKHYKWHEIDGKPPNYRKGGVTRKSGITKLHAGEWIKGRKKKDRKSGR